MLLFILWSCYFPLYINPIRTMNWHHAAYAIGIQTPHLGSIWIVAQSKKNFTFFIMGSIVSLTKVKHIPYKITHFSQFNYNSSWALASRYFHVCPHLSPISKELLTFLDFFSDFISLFFLFSSILHVFPLSPSTIFFLNRKGSRSWWY